MELAEATVPCFRGLGLGFSSLPRQAGHPTEQARSCLATSRAPAMRSGQGVSAVPCESGRLTSLGSPLKGSPQAQHLAVIAHAPRLSACS